LRVSRGQYGMWGVGFFCLFFLVSVFSGLCSTFNVASGPLASKMGVFLHWHWDDVF
jgi:hypothetical protein